MADEFSDGKGCDMSYIGVSGTILTSDFTRLSNPFDEVDDRIDGDSSTGCEGAAGGAQGCDDSTMKIKEEQYSKDQKYFLH